ncbi:MAG: trypsin-like peptidase domain-containing protein [Spirosomataceae bacterium]
MQAQWKSALIAVTASVATLVGYHFLVGEGRDVVLQEASSSNNMSRLANFAGTPQGTPSDFTLAAEMTSPSVVHIKVKSTRVRRRTPSIFDQFFGFDEDMFGGGGSQAQESSGSGVIITEDGYIVTNNHVVEGGDELEVVTYDKQSYVGKLIGNDPSTDLAVIKIEGKKMPPLVLGNSDQVRVGEWVLAVGNPFNLESTVTAGIVSAIGRNINILRDRAVRGNSFSGVDSPIESFIQTDAAVNPGNSGGALVNLRGELIGINTAIASPNGAYAGYSFAIPSSIVKKVTTDLIKFGNVQRGYLGIVPRELNTKVAEEIGIKSSTGIYVEEAPESGAAYAAGIRKGDIIEKIDGIDVRSEPKFRELIGRKRPGEKVAILLNRDGKPREVSVELRNRDGGKDLLKKDATASSSFGRLGIELESLDAATRERMGLRNGVRVKKINPNGDVAKQTDIEEGLIITRVGDVRVNSQKDVEAALSEARANQEDGVLVCGVYKGMSRNYCWAIAL